MCGAYRLQTPHEAVAGFFDADWTWDDSTALAAGEKFGPSAKRAGSTSNYRLVVKENKYTSMRWRFESNWMREKGVKVPINARAETIFTNGLFKFSARDRRCLIVCDGFFEPKGPKGSQREQYIFEFPDARPFALGGLWTSFSGEDDAFDGFVIVTTTPNSQVAPVHGRMPVILETADEWQAWMHGSENDIKRLCDPLERSDLNGSLYAPTVR